LSGHQKGKQATDPQSKFSKVGKRKHAWGEKDWSWDASDSQCWYRKGDKVARMMFQWRKRRRNKQGEREK